MTIMVGQEKPSLDDIIEHHGVKGQKWGVRRELRTAALERVGAGQGSTRDKLTAVNNSSGLSLARNHGLQGSAANAAANRRAVDARVARGEGSVNDFLKQHGGDRLFNTGGKDKDVKRAAIFDPNRKLIVEPHYSQTTKNVINDHNNMSKRDFFIKYATTKGTYERRLSKGDPVPVGKKTAGQKLNDSSFGRVAQRNVDRHNVKKFGTTG